MQRILYLSLVQTVTKGELILYILFRGIKQTVYFLRIKRYSLGKKRFTKKHTSLSTYTGTKLVHLGRNLLD